jgi:hypothetical protein
MRRQRSFQSGDRISQILSPSTELPCCDGVIRVRTIKDACALFFDIDVGIEQLNQSSQVGNEPLGPFLNQDVAFS